MEDAGGSDGRRVRRNGPAKERTQARSPPDQQPLFQHPHSPPFEFSCAIISESGAKIKGFSGFFLHFFAFGQFPTRNVEAGRKNLVQAVLALFSGKREEKVLLFPAGRGILYIILRLR